MTRPEQGPEPPERGSPAGSRRASSAGGRRHRSGRGPCAPGGRRRNRPSPPRRPGRRAAPARPGSGGRPPPAGGTPPEPGLPRQGLHPHPDQDRRRADLQVEAVPEGVGRPQRIGEAHRPHHLLQPVAGVRHLARPGRAAGDGRDQRDLRLAVAEPRGHRGGGVPGQAPSGGVERVGDLRRRTLIPCAPRRAARSSRSAAGPDTLTARGAVDRRDPPAVRRRRRGAPARSPRRPAPRPCRPPPAALGGRGPAPRPGRACPRPRNPGDAGRRQLTDAVAQHGGPGSIPHERQSAARARLDRPRWRAGRGRCARGAAASASNSSARQRGRPGQLAQVGLQDLPATAVELAPEDREGIVEPARHAGVLRALAGEQPQSTPGAPSVAARPGSGAIPSPAQGLGQLRRRAADPGAAVLQVGAAGARGGGRRRPAPPVAARRASRTSAGAALPARPSVRADSGRISGRAGAGPPNPEPPGAPGPRR